MKSRNQYINSIGLKRSTMYSLWQIVAVTGIVVALGAIFKPAVISPCPDMGCGIHTVKAGDPANLTPREIMLVESLRVFGIGELDAIENLMNKESHYNPWAVNQSSGACGMGQALPCSKMHCDLGDSVCQAKWTVDYIKRRYGTPGKAWAMWQFRLLTTGSGWY